MKVEILWGVCLRVKEGGDSGRVEVACLGHRPREGEAGCQCCCWLKKEVRRKRNKRGRERKGAYTHIYR